MDKKLIKKIINSVMLFLVWTIPGVLLSSKNYADSFIYVRVGRAFNGIEVGRLNPIDYSSSFELIRAGYDSLLASLLSITSISPLKFVYLPLGSILLPFIYYITVKSISKNSRIAAYSSVYIAYLHSLITVQYNSFIYIWTHILVLVFIIILYKYHTSGKPLYSVLLLIVFVSNFTVYHSTTGWIFFFYLLYTLLNSLVNNKNEKVRNKNVSLALAFTALYFSFESYLYTRLFPKILTTEILNPFEEGKTLFCSIFNVSVAHIEPYRLIPKTSVLSSLCTLITIILLITPILLFIIKIIISGKSINSTLSKILNNKMIIIYSAAFIPVFHIAAYYMYSGFSLSLRPMLLLYPVIMYPIIFCLFGKKSALNVTRLTNVYFILLMVVAVVGFLSFYPTIYEYKPVSNFDEISKFINDQGLSTKSNIVIADLFVHGRISLCLIIQGAETPSLLPFNSEVYSYLLNESSKNINFNYLLLNEENYKIPVTGWNWEQYTPLENYDYKLRSNANLIKVYTDGSSSLILKNT